MECAIGLVAGGHFLAQPGTGPGRGVGRAGSPGWRRGELGAPGGGAERPGATWVNVGRLDSVVTGVTPAGPRTRRNCSGSWCRGRGSGTACRGGSRRGHR